MFRAGDWTGRLWQAILVLIYGIAGISLVVNPVVGLTTLTILLIAYFLVEASPRL